MLPDDMTLAKTIFAKYVTPRTIAIDLSCCLAFGSTITLGFSNISFAILSSISSFLTGTSSTRMSIFLLAPGPNIGWMQSGRRLIGVFFKAAYVLFFTEDISAMMAPSFIFFVHSLMAWGVFCTGTETSTKSASWMHWSRLVSILTLGEVFN